MLTLVVLDWIVRTPYPIIAKDWLLILVKSRLALGSSSWSFVCHHAENGPIHRKMVVYCPLALATTSINETLFQTRKEE